MQKFWREIGSRVPPCPFTREKRPCTMHVRCTASIICTPHSRITIYLCKSCDASPGGQFQHERKILVIGAGARQLTLAAAYAVRLVVGERLALSSPAPFYFYGRMHQVHPELGGWNGSASPAPYKGRHDHEAPPSSSTATATRLRIVSFPRIL